jgi:hypothetical protein
MVMPVWVYSGTGQLRATVTVAGSGSGVAGSIDAGGALVGAADDGVAVGDAPPQAATSRIRVSGTAAGFSDGRNRFTSCLLRALQSA